MPSAAATAALIGSAWDTATIVSPRCFALSLASARGDAELHLGERLAAGKPKPARVLLHGLPLRLLTQVFQLGSGPLAEVALEQALARRTRRPAGLGDRAPPSPGCARAARRRPRRRSSARRCGPPQPRPGRGPRREVQPGARPGSVVPVVGVWPWRTSSTSVAVGGWRRRRRPPDGRSASGEAVGMRLATYRFGPYPPPLVESLSPADRLDGLADARGGHRRAAGPAPASWLGGSRSVLRSGRRFVTTTTGPGRCRRSAIPAARLVIVGLAPAAHGANRTGRMFTGDRSGDFLYAALHRAGYANQPQSNARDDGLRLTDAWVTAPVRCAPPANKPTVAERDRCRPFLERELDLLPAIAGLPRARCVRLPGARRDPRGPPSPAVRPRRRGRRSTGGRTIICSYHVSQQNTFTGRLTPAMLDEIFARARTLSD